MRRFNSDAIPRAIQRRYDIYRLQRIFHMDHPDQVRALAAHYADWCLQFDAAERGAADQREVDRMNQMWGGE